ncbi:MAG: transporter substrate-binding domain-containing protein [Sneathiella sp.]
MEGKMRALLLFACMVPVLILATIYPTPTYSEQVVLTAGLPAFPPFAYPNPEKTTPGTVVSLYKMLEKETGLKFKIHFFPYARLLKSLKDGTLDVAIMFKNQSIQKDVTYVGKVSQAKVIVMSAKGDRIKTYEDLHRFKKIAAIRKASYETRFDQDKKIKKYPVNNYLQSIEMLTLGRVDAAVGSQSGLQNAIDVQGVNTQSWPPSFELGQKEWWLHFAKKSEYQHLIPSLTKAVEKIYKPNLLYELYEQQAARQHSS